MSTPRKFYKTTITLEVLSEDPVPDPIDIDSIAYEITDGGYSGYIRSMESEEVDGPKMAELLRSQFSEPGFFDLDEDGSDLLEEEDDSEV